MTVRMAVEDYAEIDELAASWQPFPGALEKTPRSFVLRACLKRGLRELKAEVG